jgi:hypothetical protein
MKTEHAVLDSSPEEGAEPAGAIARLKLLGYASSRSSSGSCTSTSSGRG